MASMPSASSSVSSGVLTRRALLGGVAGAIVGTALHPRLDAAAIGPLGAEQRRQRAFDIRVEAAQLAHDAPVPAHPCSGDEDRYPNKIGSYSKGLPHNSVGEVDASAYDAMLGALASGVPEDFEHIPLGCGDPARQRKLINPQSGLAFDLEGTDSHQFAIPPAPALASARAAGEAVELYWMAHLRDVDFTDFASNGRAAAACQELSQLTDFRGPKQGGLVTPQTLFRDNLPGATLGPYLSQFMLKSTPFGAEVVDRRMRTLESGIDYVTSFDEWLDLQRGCPPAETNQFDPVRRYIRNSRDLTQWVHIDVLYQAYFDAALILLHPPAAGGLGAPLNPGNPYRDSRTQEGFGTFGGPYIMTILTEVATRALKAVWYQKWFVHRRLRPEAFGGRVHRRATGQANYPLHADILNSQALSRTFSRFGTGLLPQAYPEGSPLHPSYGAGHATVAGACVTILKALFDESFVVPDPVVPNPRGRQLLAYEGPDADSLTVGGELNKLASNVATGRNMAGIHWRSDGAQSLTLGEAVAISVLRDQRVTYNEAFQGFTFTRFDGTGVTV